MISLLIEELNDSIFTKIQPEELCMKLTLAEIEAVSLIKSDSDNTLFRIMFSIEQSKKAMIDS